MRLLIATLVLTGCMTGPKTEKKNALNVLNGENYQVNSGSGASVGPVPIPLNVERRDRPTRIEGRVHTGNDAFASFAPRILISLMDKQGRELEHTMSDADGKFSFVRPLPNGRYSIRSASPSFRGEARFDVSAYEVKDLVLEVH